MRNLAYLLFFLLAFSIESIGQNNFTLPEKIDVSIFSGSLIKDISFTNLEGRYYIYSENEEQELAIRKFSSVRVQAKNDTVQVLRMDTVVFAAKKVYLSGHGFNNYLLINPLATDLPFRIYDDDIIITASESNIKLINHVALEKYVAAVVQSESGFLRHPVYYEVQATIARTYALKNINRHAHEQHNLCDRVHCQAYYGKTSYQPIIDAVNNSKGTIIVDENNMPVNTVYHANCGGETINSEDLWGSPLPYLRSVKDTFCLNSPGANWQMKVNAKEVYDFIEDNFNIKLEEKELSYIQNFYQNSRKLFFDETQLIHLKYIREQFGLRSTFFSVALENDSLIFNGRGFGHGVGLCQEGAMRMAELGFSKDSIIKYFYYNVNLINLEDNFR
ncbi:MAG: SpoIID/LytB domain-containing protein [Bacteroidales bacterium]